MTHFPTPEALILQKELAGAHHLDVRSEQSDGHKHIDLAIPLARLNIEVDGLQHLTNMHQILSDLARAHYSDDAGYDTLHIPNTLIHNDLPNIANAIAQVAHQRIRCFNGNCSH